jgi:hypothetical protein
LFALKHHQHHHQHHHHHHHHNLKCDILCASAYVFRLCVSLACNAAVSFLLLL